MQAKITFSMDEIPMLLRVVERDVKSVSTLKSKKSGTYELEFYNCEGRIGFYSTGNGVHGFEELPLLKVVYYHPEKVFTLRVSKHIDSSDAAPIRAGVLSAMNTIGLEEKQ